jgi:hypothetical protein
VGDEGSQLEPVKRALTRDHPHEIISPHIMRFEEIRGWLREFSTNPEWGWMNRGLRGLGRALGMASKTSIERKLTTGWIWPKEQVRLTARINDIRQGYIVPTLFGNRTDGVWTDPPRPPVVREKPKSIALRATVKGSILVAHDQKPAMKLPAFRRSFAEAPFWDPDNKRR